MKSLLLLDLTGRVFLQKEKILYWLVSAFFISLFLPDMPVINNILIGATVLHSFFYNSFAEKGQLLKARKQIWMMILFFLLQVVSAAVSVNRQEALVMLTLRLPLIVFPLCFGLLYIREELKDRILLSYCFFTTMAAMGCMIYAIWQYGRTGDSALLYNDSLTEAIGRQSIYVAMAINLALFTYVYLLQKKSFAIQYKGLVFLSIAFLVVFHYMLANRIAIITLYGGFGVFALWHYGRTKRVLRGAFLVVVLLAGAILMMRFFPRTVNRFKQLDHISYRYNSQAGEAPDSIQLNEDQWNAANFRLAIWKCGWQLFCQHPLLGVPLGDKQQRLMEVYKARQFDFALRLRLNMHNTYLDTLCNVGIIGLLVFLLGYLLFPLATAFRTGDGLSLFIIFAFAMTMSTETWTDRSVGCIMLAFFLSLVSAWEKKPDPAV
jgi:O-antigen ligase